MQIFSRQKKIPTKRQRKSNGGDTLSLEFENDSYIPYLKLRIAAFSLS